MSESILSAYPPLNLPAAALDIRRGASGRREVFDRWRNRWVVLTPEEWVRQHFVSMLVSEKGYISGRIANEISISLNGMSRRCDTVIYDSAMHPVMIVEYKAPTVQLSQQAFDQIARYAMVLRTPLLAVSNGMCHYCCRMDYENGACVFLKDVPCYDSIV